MKGDYVKALATIFVFLLFAASVSGCGKPKAHPPRPLIAPPEQSFTFRGGPERRIYESPFSAVWDAALAALGRLNMRITKTLPALGRIDARDSEGNPVILELAPKDTGSTYVEIQTVLGNERIASDINPVIAAILKNSQPPPKR